MTSIPVRLFGRPEIEAALQSRVFPSRGYCLLAMLALAPTRSTSRALAAAQLWDSQDTHANLGNMRQLLLRMQKAMPSLSSIIAVDEKSLRIIDPSQIDVCRFLDSDDLSTGRGLSKLMDIYRGDLLQGIDLGVADDPFTVGRTYLRERYFGFAYSAVKELTRYGHADSSVIQAWERQALAIDSGREETYRTLIAAYGALGRGDDSRRVFALLTDMVRLEGGDGPQSDTRTMLARATAKAIDLRSAPIDQASRGGARPRVALLAPNWVTTSGTDNFLRLFVEDMANELARYKSIVALAAHSTFQAPSDGGVLDDNSRLRADYTVGTLVRPGPGLGELTVRLVSSRSRSILWAADYPLTPDLMLQSNRTLVARIVAGLSAAVERDSLASPQRTDMASAYMMFLRGQEALKSCDLRSVRRARRWYAQAVSEDHRFADAYSGLSCSLYLEWLLLGGNDPKLLVEARELAERAVQCDPSNSTGYWRKAMAALYQHDFDGSETSFRKAQELHPNSADILLDHSDAMGFVGDANEAWTMFERALDLNPTPPDHYWWAGASIAFSQADYAKAIDLCARLGSDESVLRLLAASHGHLGNLTEAREYGRRLLENYPNETAESMTRLQPHRTQAGLEPFMQGLRIAGVK